MDPIEHKRPGRPPIFNPVGRVAVQKVHLSLDTEVWKAVRNHSLAIGEPSLSRVARILLRERLTQLGYLKSPGQSHSGPTTDTTSGI